MHALVLLALAVLVLVVLGVVICFCYSLESSPFCPAALRMNTTTHSVAGLYNGYVDGKTSAERSSLAECSYSSTIELYDSTFHVKEPSCRFAPVARQQDLKVRRLYVGEVLEGDMVHGDVTLEKLDGSRRASSVLCAPCNCELGAPLSSSGSNRVSMLKDKLDDTCSCKLQAIGADSERLRSGTGSQQWDSDSPEAVHRR